MNTYNLDITRRGRQFIIEGLHVGDNGLRTYQFVFSRGGDPFPLPDACIATLYATLPDKTVIYSGLSIQKNTVIYTLTGGNGNATGLTSLEGCVECEIRITGSNGEILTSPRFSFLVDAVLQDDSAIEAQESFSALTDALGRVLAAENGLTTKPEEILFYYDEGGDYNEKNIESFLRLYELQSEGAPYTIKMIEEDYTVLPCELDFWRSKKWILKAYAVDDNCIYYITVSFSDGGVSSVEYEMGELTASDVGADKKGTAAAAVAAHNESSESHSDVRQLLTSLENLVCDVEKRLEGVADSDDETLDQLSEIVAYIKSNKGLIDAVTTAKVSYSDIIDDLITDDASKPLSAAQGLVLKALIDAVKNSVPKVYTVPYYSSPTSAQKQEVISTIKTLIDDTDSYSVFINVIDRNTIIPAECAIVKTATTCTVTIRGIQHNTDVTPAVYTILSTIRSNDNNNVSFSLDLYMVSEISDDMPSDDWYKSPTSDAVYEFVTNYVDQQIVKGAW